jgi:ribosomal protein S18 acetylase RimI-like enzyme
MNINVRIATPADALVIIEFNAAMAKETENIELDRDRLRSGVEAILSDTAKGLYYVAEVDDKVVGQLMITYEWSDWRNADFWWIQSVYVHPEYRKQGIFRSLHRHIESLAQARGTVCGMRLYVDKKNKRAQRSYEALGMKQSHYQMMEVAFVLDHE